MLQAVWKDSSTAFSRIFLPFPLSEIPHHPMALAEKTESQQQKLARRKEEATPTHQRAPRGPAVFESAQIQTKEDALPESKPLDRKSVV